MKILAFVLTLVVLVVVAVAAPHSVSGPQQWDMILQDGRRCVTNMHYSDDCYSCRCVDGSTSSCIEKDPLKTCGPPGEAPEGFWLKPEKL